MDWKKTVSEIAPTIGSLFGAPGVIAGNVIKGILNLPDNASDDDILTALADPANHLKLKEAEYNYKKAQLDADTQRIIAINQTMQAETKSEHWAQWGWRPFNGFLFGITLFSCYGLPMVINCLILPIASSLGHQVAPLGVGSIPPEALMAWGALQGITSWHRGKEKVIKAEK